MTTTLTVIHLQKYFAQKSCRLYNYTMTGDELYSKLKAMYFPSNEMVLTPKDDECIPSTIEGSPSCCGFTMEDDDNPVYSRRQYFSDMQMTDDLQVYRLSSSVFNLFKRCSRDAYVLQRDFAVYDQEYRRAYLRREKHTLEQGLLKLLSRTFHAPKSRIGHCIMCRRLFYLKRAKGDVINVCHACLEWNIEQRCIQESDQVIAEMSGYAAGLCDEDTFNMLANNVKKRKRDDGVEETNKNLRIQ